MRFENCECTNGGGGGGVVEATPSDSEYIVFGNDVLFDGCSAFL